MSMTKADRAALERVPYVPWEQFLAQWVWNQGEHMSTVGPTGSGKSTLVRALLPRRKYVIVLGTKPRDRVLDKLVRVDGFTRITEWPPPTPPWWRQITAGWDDRLILWPPFRHADDRAVQRDVFERALGDVFAEGGWTVVVDEAFYLADELGLKRWLTTLWTQGRSNDLSVVAGTQRPAFVPLHMYDQAAHLFFFADNDEVNLRRVGGLGGLSARVVRETVAALPRHQVLYVDTRNRTLLRTRVK